MSSDRSWPVVVFDLDGTLLRETTVSLMLAEWLGKTEEVAALERAYSANEISNSLVADTSARWLAGKRMAEVWDVLEGGPWIEGMAETLETLAEAGTKLLLGTITWRFAAELLQERYGFAAVSGTEMSMRGDVLSGTVERNFDEHDKLRFVEGWCERHRYELGEVIAIGDSRSDVPLFARAGASIALNASPEARSAATYVLDTDDLRDVLRFALPGGAHPAAQPDPVAAARERSV